MKTTGTKNIFTVALLLIFSVMVVTSFAEDKEKTFSVKKGDILKVSTHFGNVTYSKGSSSEVKVMVKNILSEELQFLKMEKSGSIVNIEFEGEDSHRLRFEITGPSTLDLDFSTGGGNVSVQVSMEGNVDITTGGGNVETQDINGVADITTGGGNVSLKNVLGNADVTTGGGEVEVGIIEGTADITTGGGNITVQSINKSADLSTGGGNISVSTVNGNADINTGGGNIKVGKVSGTADVNTGGGNIMLESASGKVDVNTGAGNLTLKNITGYLDANTGSGNIYAEITPDGKNKSELNTGNGDIVLMIPSTAKARITATVHVVDWEDHLKGIEPIFSDFEPVSVKRVNGKKRIEAIFELNGGGSEIELNSGLGEIEIKKLK
ncbi:MAG: hypothetical protein PVF17_06755 [Ignavibacteria bacterium]